MDAWFVMMGARIEGPLDLKDVLQRLGTGDVSPAQFAWKDGGQDWKRLIEFEEFQQVLPKKPASELIEKIKDKIASSQAQDPPSPEAVREWYAYIKGSQEGPYDKHEVIQLINAGAILSDTYLWKVGMDNWAFLKDLKIFSEVSAKEGSAESSEESEKRAHPRKPVVARVLFHDERLLGQGICRDVSVGGAQILFDTKGGDNPNVRIGDVLHMNVHGGDNFSAFTAEASVVRILKNNQGFAVRFVNLTDKTSSSLEAILND